MSDLVKQESGFMMKPKSFDEALKLCEFMAQSDLVGKDYKGKPANIFIACQMGAELGMHILQAVQNISVINGKAAVWGDMALALVQRSPDYVAHEEGVEGEGEARVGYCTITRRGQPPHRQEFSVADAKKARLWGKQGPWTEYPERMLKLRARGFAIRDKFADAMKGLITREEAEDYNVVAQAGDGRGEVVEVKPRGAKALAAAVGLSPPAVDRMLADAAKAESRGHLAAIYNASVHLSEEERALLANACATRNSELQAQQEVGGE